MNTTRTIRAFVLAALVAASVLAGCGSDDDGAYGGKGGSTDDGQATGGEVPKAFVSTGDVPVLDLVLTDAAGYTLYDFHKDEGTKSSCYGACAKVWPPLLTDGKPQGAYGASGAKLGTTRRSDGTVQVTYAGHPVYTYAADKQAGEANGHDIESFGAEWYALKPSGAEAED